MRLLLVRHAESEHNVAGLLAGVTDSSLTNHGVLQTQRLGKYLAERYTFTQIYSSDLQRAHTTAKAIVDAQRAKNPDGRAITVVSLEVLREQDFGSLERVPWSSKRSELTAPKLLSPEDVGFKPKESSEAMTERANLFLNDFILPHLAVDQEEECTLAVVSHGLILAVLWKAVLGRFGPGTVSLGPEIGSKTGSRPLEYLPGWSNTGYLHLEISASSAPPQNASTNVMVGGPATLLGYRMLIRAVNSKDHLSNLKRTRGIGSSTYDARQQDLKGYFKKPKTASTGQSSNVPTSANLKDMSQPALTGNAKDAAAE